MRGQPRKPRNGEPPSLETTLALSLSLVAGRRSDNRSCLWSYAPTVTTLALAPVERSAVFARLSGAALRRGHAGHAFQAEGHGHLAIQLARRATAGGRACGSPAGADDFYFARDRLDAFSLVICVGGLFAGSAACAALAVVGRRRLLTVHDSAAVHPGTVRWPIRCEPSPPREATTFCRRSACRRWAQGHTILFHDVRLGVAEACSGLSMLVIFLALSTAVAITIRRPLLDRVVVLLSAVPVAVLANVRGSPLPRLMHQWVGREWADLVFHDLAGWLMMPFALAVLGGELRSLLPALVERPARRPVPLALE